MIKKTAITLFSLFLLSACSSVVSTGNDSDSNSEQSAQLLISTTDEIALEEEPKFYPPRQEVDAPCKTGDGVDGYNKEISELGIRCVTIGSPIPGTECYITDNGSCAELEPQEPEPISDICTTPENQTGYFVNTSTGPECIALGEEVPETDCTLDEKGKCQPENPIL